MLHFIATDGKPMGRIALRAALSVLLAAFVFCIIVFALLVGTAFATGRPEPGPFIFVVVLAAVLTLIAAKRIERKHFKLPASIAGILIVAVSFAYYLLPSAEYKYSTTIAPRPMSPPATSPQTPLSG